MKRNILSLTFIFAALMAMAASNPSIATSAKAVNLKEVAINLEYPVDSKINGTEGTVLMYVEIDENGKVSSKTALAYPCNKLREAAEKAVDNLKFEAAIDASGQAIKSGVRIPFEFKLTID